MNAGRVMSLFAGLVAVGATIGAFVWLAQARAETDRVAELKALCEEEGAYHTRAPALRELVEIGSDASRAALADLADAANEPLAVQTIAALGRSGDTSSKSKLAAIVADSDRSDHVRSMAVTAHLRADHRDGATRSTAQGRFSSERRGESALDDAAKATEARLWGEE